MNGFLPIDKPSGVTSRAVVNRVESWFPGVKIGHTGTLDPRATGVLVLAMGSGTRLVEQVQQMGKTYRSRFYLGAVSTTDDADGQIEPVPGTVAPTELQIRQFLAGMTGEITQVPPDHSAVWVEGHRAYALARKGNAVDLTPRMVRIDYIRMVKYDFPHLDLEIDCGKGTYIRSIARDLGQQLGCGAYVDELCRTRIGPFTLKQCVSSESTPADARLHLQPLARAVTELTQISLPEEELLRLLYGQKLLVPRIATLPEGPEIAVLNQAGDLHSLCVIRGGRLKPLRVFMTDLKAPSTPV